jgi:aspartate racemase
MTSAATPAGPSARRIVGVLGGMGPAASAYFCLRLAQATAARRDQDHLHVILDSDPSVPDRTDFLLGRGQDPVPALITMARRLTAAGADLLVMACNSASPFTAQVAEAVSAEMVDWVGGSVGAIIASRPAQPAVGLLATEGTAASGVYQRHLKEQGATVILPDQAMQAEVTAAIYDVKSGATGLEGRQESVLEVASSLASKGADSLLISCTELSLLFSGTGSDWPVPATDALDAVAARTVALAGGVLRRSSSTADTEQRK